MSVQLYLCVSAYFLPPLHFLGDCNYDDVCVMKRLKHDIGGMSTESLYLVGLKSSGRNRHL